MDLHVKVWFPKDTHPKCRYDARRIYSIWFGTVQITLIKLFVSMFAPCNAPVGSSRFLFRFWGYWYLRGPIPSGRSFCCELLADSVLDNTGDELILHSAIGVGCADIPIKYFRKRPQSNKKLRAGNYSWENNWRQNHKSKKNTPCATQNGNKWMALPTGNCLKPPPEQRTAD